MLEDQDEPQTPRPNSASTFSKQSTLAQSLQNARAYLGMEKQHGVSRNPSARRSGFAAYLEQPEHTVDVLFEALFYALKRPGWHTEVIEFSLKCLREYAQFKSQNFSSVQSKQRFVNCFQKNLARVMSLFDQDIIVVNMTQMPDSISGGQPAKKKPLKLSTETLKNLLVLFNQFY